MDDLAVSMHTGIGAPCTVDTNLAVRHGGESVLQSRLYRVDVEVWLRLPTVVGAAIVFNPARYPAAHRKRVGRER
jgi:hypothetical protein